uniref:CRISPR-associated helicase Cas3 n=1 Tax=Ignisphaera aggregans TaxID=334771 RepID=A0A7C4BBS5_9CREN
MGMRRVIEEAVSIFKETLQQRGMPVFVLSAPTGYGKTVAGPAFYKVCYEEGVCNRILHVLPLRSIVRDFYLCKLLGSFINSLDQQTVKSIAESCGDSTASHEFAEIVKSAKLSASDVAYQMGEEIECEVARKRPLFDARYVVTTADSFFYNLFRIPVTEIFSPRKHYAIPRLRVYTSITYFDEAHMIVEEEGEESKMYTLFLHALDILRAMKVPIILASATLPTKFIEELAQRVGEDLRVVMLGTGSERSNIKISVEDKEFIKGVVNINWNTAAISENEVINIIRNYGSSHKIFVGCDTVKKAIERFRKAVSILDSGRVAILNGLMTRGDRARNLMKLRKAQVLVSTSVAEAGIDVSFDILISDAMRIPSLIQRAGRVCRHIDEHPCEKAEVYIVKEFASKDVLSFIGKYKKVCWRLPFDHGGYVGYQRLIDMWSPPKVDKELNTVLRHLIYSLYVSAELIDSVLSSAGGALTRATLAEVIVTDDISDIKSAPAEKLYENGLTLDLERIAVLYKEKCVDTIVAYSIDEMVFEDISRDSEYRHLVERIGRDPEAGAIHYFRLVKDLAKKGMHVAFVVNSKCYSPGEGLKL